MKVNSVGTGVNITDITSKRLNFRSKTVVHAPQNGHDKFQIVNNEKRNRILRFLGALSVVGIGLLLVKLTNKKSPKNIFKNSEFKNINQAKEYFEKLGINTEFRDVNNEYLPMLNRIKDDMKKLKELGVKFDRPNTLTISDWHKTEEYEELCRKRGVSVIRKEGYYAFCQGDKHGANHIFINASHKHTDVFRHEMGHANHHRGHDSFWEAKGIKNHDFADKQLEILGQDIKVYRGTDDFKNIFYFHPNQDSTKFAFPNRNMETRFIYIKNIVNKMNEETGCYKPDSLFEQVAYVFDGLTKGDKQFSDEVMLYYDFAGGARIPNLKINGKTYDEYIESLYNNKDLIQKLKENIKISKV